MLYDLFVVGDEANSKKAIRLRTTDCNLCDVRQMQQIPTFLKGVPSLYIRESKLVMTGTQCLNFLQSLQESTLNTMIHFPVNHGSAYAYPIRVWVHV